MQYAALGVCDACAAAFIGACIQGKSNTHPSIRERIPTAASAALLFQLATWT